MGGGKGSKAPKAPDYAAAAKAQGEADLKTAQYTTALDRPAQTDPYGAMNWTFTGAGGGTRDAPRPGDWQQSVSLTPQEQQIFNAEQGNRLGMEGLASTAIGQAGNTLNSPFSPQLLDFRQAQGLQGSNTGLPQNTLGGMQDVGESPDHFRAQGEQVRNSLYDQMTRFADERFGRAEDTERTRLAQMGLQEGSEAYQNSLREFNRSKDESYQGAQLASVLAGGQEQSRMLSDLLASRESNIGLRQGQFGQDMALYGADQGERQAQATSELNLAQQAAQQRQQQLSEQAYQRSLPINEISALLGGGGVNMPQFANFAPSTPFNSPDLLGATQAQYNAAMGQYNAGRQGKGSMLGAGAGLLGSFMGGK